MTAYTDTWSRIEQANVAAGWPNDWTVAELDQIEALAEDLNRAAGCTSRALVGY
jgi:hypothetical protein